MVARQKALFKGLKFRFVMLVCGIFFSIIGVQLFADTTNQIREIRKDRATSAASAAALIARDLEQRNVDFDKINLQELLSRASDVPEKLKISLISKDLQRSFGVDGHNDANGESEFSSALLEPLSSGASQFLATKESLQVGQPILNDGMIAGSVMVETANPQFLETMLPILKSKLTSGLPLMIAGILACLGLLSQATNPISRLAEQLNAIAAGKQDEMVETDGPSEVRALGRSINAMMRAAKENIDEIHELAYVDPTTRLPNREYFRNELTRAMCRAARVKVSGALLFVDLDGFKKVNDTLGHDFGDKLLAAFADRISKIVRVEDTVAYQDYNDSDQKAADEDGREKQVLARLGGDEFTILLGEIREETDAAQVARRIINSTARPFLIDDKEIRVGVSVGIATFPRDGENYEEVLKSADMAMYLAKEEGKNTFRFFSEELNEKASLRMEVESDLREAVARDQLELYLQPKVSCEDGRPVSFEALIRWHHPEKGIVQPGEFIKIAEETGLIIPMGDWVLRQACNYIKELEELELDFPVAVNISTQQFEQEDFADRALKTVRDQGIQAKHLEIEITESMAMNNPQRALEHFRKLKRARMRIAIDDFGTGYSNLSQLSRLPFDVFKIDRSFVEGISDEFDTHGKAIVRTILAMAKSLDYETVAEGVENEEQRQLLADLGCDYAQGFLFAKPMPAAEAFDWLKAQNVDKKSRTNLIATSKKCQAA